MIQTHHDNIPDFAETPDVIVSDQWPSGIGSSTVVRVEGDVTISGSVQAKAIGVAGTLRLAAGTVLTVQELLVYESGTLEIGTPAQPGQAVVEFADVPLDALTDPSQFGNGLIVLGTIRVYGQPVKPWVRLAAPLLTGQTQIQLTEEPGWKVGDKIAVAATVFASDKLFETFTVSAISGSTVTLDHAATFDHKGALNHDGTPAVWQGQQLHAHAANLTRSVVFRSVNPSGTRGHFMATGGRPVVEIRHAAFENMGRTTIANLDSTTYDAEGNVTHVGMNQIGRYSVHIHHVYGPVGGLPVDAVDHAALPQTQFRLVGNAIVGDSKWGVAIHDSHYGLVRDNVSQSSGAGYTTEDGSETGNVFVGNFAFGTPGNGSIERYDTLGVRGAGFWLRGAHNHFVENAAAGGEEGFGFYLILSGAPGFDNAARVPLFPGASTYTEGQYQVSNIGHLPLLGWDMNEAYAHRQQGVGCWFLQVTYPTFTDTALWGCVQRAIHLDYSSGLFDGLLIRQCGLGLNTHNPNSLSGNPLHLRNYDVQDVVSMTKEDDRPLLKGLFENGVVAATSHWVINSSQQGTNPRTYTFIRPRFLQVGSNPLKAIETRIDSRWSRGGGYMLFVSSPISVSVEGYQGVEGDDFRVWFNEQKPDYVLTWPETGDVLSYQIPGGALLTVEKGLTAAENWTKYASGLLMELGPFGTTTRPEIIGRIEGSDVPPPPPPEVWEAANIGPPFNGDEALRVRGGLVEQLQ